VHTMINDLERTLADRVALQIAEIGRLEGRLERVTIASQGKDYKLARQRADLGRLYEEVQRLKAKLEEKGVNEQGSLPIEKAVRDAQWTHHLNLMRLKSNAYDIREKMMAAMFGSATWDNLADQLKFVTRAISSIEAG